VEIPEQLLLTPDAAVADPEVGPLFVEARHRLADHELLSAFLMYVGRVRVCVCAGVCVLSLWGSPPLSCSHPNHACSILMNRYERAKGERSWYWPYLATLPAPDTAVTWTHRELLELQNP
jgi:hypothetical protein